MIAALLSLLLAVDPPQPALETACIDAERLAEARSLALPRGDERRVLLQLEKVSRCAWLQGFDGELPAAILRLPEPLAGPYLIEIATDLDAASALVAHVALLDGEGRPTRIAPWTSFRERRGARILRFILRPTDVPGYLWIGAAADAWPYIARRNFRATSTRVLAVIGLETGGERSALVASRLTGEVSILIERLGGG